MKITIEPSVTDDMRYFPTITLDTRTNEDSTADVVKAALGILITAGHHPLNVSNAAQQQSIEIQQANNNTEKE